jgi:Protein of unknown function DUF262/Protein of unknown function (DUF1524)
MSQPIYAHEEPVHKVFSDDYLFSIPGYQRPYSWTKEQAGVLLDDLQAQLHQGGAESSYFLGSIVLIKHKGAPQADVVDGQQRLTTLTILFAALRDVASADKAAKLQKYLWQEGNEFEGTANIYRLNLRQQDTDFFIKYVQTLSGIRTLVALPEKKLSSSQCRIRENAACFLEKLSTMPETERDKLTAFLVRQCYLVVVAASDKEAAYRIFSVMNDRGLDLSPTDILKSEIIGAIAGEENQKKYTRIWEDQEDAIGRKDFAEFFSHVRMIYAKVKQRESLAKEFKEALKPLASPISFIEKTLVPMGEAFQQLTTATYTADRHVDAINRYLGYLNRLDNRDWLPPAIAAALPENPERLLRFVKGLDRLAYMLYATRSNINERISRYAKVLSVLEGGDEAIFAEASPLNLTENEQRDFVNALNQPLDNSKLKMRSILLLRVDAALCDGSVRYDHPVITVEHVLPQTPAQGSDWLRHFPDVDLRERMTHLIGNMALLSRSKNSAAQNYDFFKKRDTYFRQDQGSGFMLTSQVLAENEWTPTVISKRQQTLLNRLCKEWGLPTIDVQQQLTLAA